MKQKKRFSGGNMPTTAKSILSSHIMSADVAQAFTGETNPDDTDEGAIKEDEGKGKERFVS